MTPPPRRLGVGGALIILVWLAAFAALLARTVPVSGDGIYYFVQLESLVQDHDVDYANNLEAFRANPHVARQLDSGVVTATGRTPNLFSVGPALVWAPLYALSLRLPGIADVTLRGVPIALAVPSITTALVVLVGLLSMFGVGRRLGLGSRASTLGVIVGFLGTNLLYYSTFEASMAHGLGFGLVSLLLYAVVRRHTSPKPDRPGLPVWLGLGFLAGLIGLIRWQLLLVSLPLILFALWSERKRAPSSSALTAVLVSLTLGLVIGIAPQLLIWQALYGEWLLIPQGAGFIVPTSPHFGEVLVSARHGWLTWTPLVLIGLAGLVVAARSALAKPIYTLAPLLTAIVFVQIYVNGSLVEWWGGDAFGARRFADITGIVMLGLMVMFSLKKPRLRGVLILVASLAILVNLTLMQFYRHGQISRSQPVPLSIPLERVVDTLRE